MKDEDTLMTLPEGLTLDLASIYSEDAYLDEPEQDKGRCNHKWIEYIGFNDAFEFCELCDEKREIK